MHVTPYILRMSPSTLISLLKVEMLKTGSQKAEPFVVVILDFGSALFRSDLSFQGNNLELIHRSFRKRNFVIDI